jgi:lipid-binding SYLF domain-containing protein
MRGSHVTCGRAGRQRLSASTTTNLGGDAYSSAKTQELDGGLSLEGAGIPERSSWNTEYYGAGATPARQQGRRDCAHRAGTALSRRAKSGSAGTSADGLRSLRVVDAG